MCREAYFMYIDANDEECNIDIQRTDLATINILIKKFVVILMTILVYIQEIG